MPIVNEAERLIVAKLVVAGPAGAGKRTNLARLCDRLDCTQASTEELHTAGGAAVSLKLGAVKGYETLFHVYALPGQLVHGELRGRLLIDAEGLATDGVLFVADSAAGRIMANAWSLQDLTGRLGGDVAGVIQYNKRDLKDTLDVPTLRERLNPHGWPEVEAVAREGQGVVDSFQALVKQVLRGLSLR